MTRNDSPKDESRFRFILETPKGEAGVYVAIPWFEGPAVWAAEPASVLGRDVGMTFWKGKELGLFGDVLPQQGGKPLAVLFVPEVGFDEASLGSTGKVRMANGASGTWKLVGKERFIESYWKLEKRD
ncbi:hypothetical protein [Pacificoceanicola onchidii]|uniref:hypothetical protein n=1 Tax=Pacificoceanicola onchidii TaxID=2562685 RepID=UPI0010A57A98|nr:hypothetical protein [Pacificoceanicola onchidii]